MNIFQFYLETVHEIKPIFHVSIKPIKTLGHTPMWFSDDIKHAKEYYKNVLGDGFEHAYMYQGEIIGEILTSKELKALLQQHNIDEYNFIAELVSNPNSAKITKQIEWLKKHCDGFYHSDYDPSDWSNDIETLLIFDPAMVKNWKAVSVNE